jgi:plastocyanin
MYPLDSRSLGMADCFIQRFTVSGTVPYWLARAPVPEVAPVGETAFAIIVGERPRETPAESAQHNVVVRMLRGRLQADPQHVEISVGDTVRWHTQELTVRFAVRGGAEEFSFDSRAMSSECAYTHAFANAGKYQWLDANGHPLSGEVDVANPDASDEEQRGQWTEALKKGTTITIEGERIEPTNVQVLTGQTVAWVVVRAPGIAVTDARFVSTRHAE